MQVLLLTLPSPLIDPSTFPWIWLQNLQGNLGVFNADSAESRLQINSPTRLWQLAQLYGSSEQGRVTSFCFCYALGHRKNTRRLVFRDLTAEKTRNANNSETRLFYTYTLQGDFIVGHCLLDLRKSHGDTLKWAFRNPYWQVWISDYIDVHDACVYIHWIKTSGKKN